MCHESPELVDSLVKIPECTVRNKCKAYSSAPITEQHVQCRYKLSVVVNRSSEVQVAGDVVRRQ